VTRGRQYLGPAGKLASPDKTVSTAELIVAFMASKLDKSEISAPLVYNENRLELTRADSTHDGYLTATDWNKFNSKQDTTSLLGLSLPPIEEGQDNQTIVKSGLRWIWANSNALNYTPVDKAGDKMLGDLEVQGLKVNENLRRRVDVFGSDVTLDGTMDIVLMNSSAAAVITLPAAANFAGYSFSIKNIGSANVSIVPSNLDLIEGVSSWILGTMNHITVTPYQNSWYIL
jgi:hypothetical protein